VGARRGHDLKRWRRGIQTFTCWATIFDCRAKNINFLISGFNRRTFRAMTQLNGIGWPVPRGIQVWR